MYIPQLPTVKPMIGRQVFDWLSRVSRPMQCNAMANTVVRDQCDQRLCYDDIDP